MDYPDDLMGMNTIKEPKELQLFLVVFRLKTKNRTICHGVLLPGPTSPGISIYQWLSNIDQTHTQIEVLNVPKGDYLGNPKLAFASHAFWEQVI